MLEKIYFRLKLLKYGILRPKMKIGYTTIEIPPDLLFKAIKSPCQETTIKYSVWAEHLARAYCPPGDEECVKKVAGELSKKIVEKFKLEG